MRKFKTAPPADALSLARTKPRQCSMLIRARLLVAVEQSFLPPSRNVQIVARVCLKRNKVKMQSHTYPVLSNSTVSSKGVQRMIESISSLWKSSTEVFQLSLTSLTRKRTTRTRYFRVNTSILRVSLSSFFIVPPDIEDTISKAIPA